jgi:hypothetical protein
MDYARERHIEGFTAQVLARNAAMMRVFSKWCSPMQATLSGGVYELSIRFSEIDKARRQDRRKRSANQPAP